MLDLMTNKKICFLTTVFPMKIEYLYDFFDSISKQNYPFFELVIVNDGNRDLSKVLREYTSLKTHLIAAGKNPLHNRELLMKFAINNSYDIAIFGDSDDKFSDNRIADSVDKLSVADIVVNELSTFNSLRVLQHNYLSNRLDNNADLQFSNIIDCNVFGLSNTAVNCHILKDLALPFDEELIALDWYIYSVLLLKKRTAIFTNECTTYYRQHESNQVGIGKVDRETIENAIRVKIKHYAALSMHYGEALKLKSDLEVLINDEQKILKLLKTQQKINYFPLWWETK